MTAAPNHAAAAWTPTGPYWHRWRDEFAKALDERLYTIDYLDRLLLDGQAQIWFGDEAAIVTEIRPYPTGAHAIHGVVAAGELSEIIGHLIPKAEDWGRSIGCILSIIESRPGWVRKLKGAGYEIHQTAVRKEL